MGLEGNSVLQFNAVPFFPPPLVVYYALKIEMLLKNLIQTKSVVRPSLSILILTFAQCPFLTAPVATLPFGHV